MKSEIFKWKYLFIIAFTIIFVSIFLFTDGFKYVPIYNTYTIYEGDDIEIVVDKIEEGVIFYTLVNDTTEEIAHGVDEFIQKKGIFKWKTLPSNAFHVLLEQYTQPGAEVADKALLELYGKLNRGRYRIVKPIKINNNEIYISGEFNIN